jgi:hypothetical protein
MIVDNSGHSSTFFAGGSVGKRRKHRYLCGPYPNLRAESILNQSLVNAARFCWIAA